MDIKGLFPDGADKLAVAGFSGAVVFWITNRKNKSEGLMSLIVGVLSAVYLGPIVEPFLAQLVGVEVSYFLSGFICGLTGIVINGAIAEAVNKSTGMMFKITKTEADVKITTIEKEIVDDKNAG